jgi:cell division protein FtsL
MAAGNRRHNAYDDYRTNYIEGNTVRKLNAVPERRREEQYEIPSRKKHVTSKPKKLNGIGKASLLVLTAAAAVTLYFCVDYLMLHYQVSATEKLIAKKEQELKIAKSENDAAYEQINLAYDLDYVYRVAVEELGMVYPKDNKVISYRSEAEDYVRQYADIPE